MKKLFPGLVETLQARKNEDKDKEYVGTRLMPDTKAWLTTFCKTKKLGSVATVLEELVENFKREMTK